jgi:hypothetical protein
MMLLQQQLLQCVAHMWEFRLLYLLCMLRFSVPLHSLHPLHAKCRMCS